MENERTGNYNPEDRDSEARQAGTNRDNAIVNRPEMSDESGTSPSRNDARSEQYNAGGTDRLTGTSSVSDSRAAEGVQQNETAYGSGKNTNQDQAQDETLSAGQNEFDSENLDDEDDDFLKGSGRDYGQEDRSMQNNSLDPDFDRNAEV